MTNKLLTESLSEPLNSATTATIDISSGIGNMTIDGLTDVQQVLASGTLQYFEKQGVPDRSLTSDHGQAIFTVREEDIGRHWFRLPWEACLGANEWQIDINPAVACDITAHTGGGNVNLDLAGMAVTHLAADTGGGNMEVVLPDHATNLAVTARTGGGNVSVDIGDAITGCNTVDATSGAGNVVVRVPNDVPARVHATSGLGKVVVEPRFSRVDVRTYQTPDYDGAINRLDITLIEWRWQRDRQRKVKQPGAFERCRSLDADRQRASCRANSHRSMPGNTGNQAMIGWSEAATDSGQQD